MGQQEEAEIRCPERQGRRESGNCQVCCRPIDVSVCRKPVLAPGVTARRQDEG